MSDDDTTSHYDYVIVGGGTAGCLMANRLSAQRRHKVLLIEAGGRDDYAWIHIPVGYLYCIGNPRTDWLYQTEPDAGLNGRSLRYPRGKVLGGCSSINGMIYMRGQARDYDGWATALGDDAWRWDHCLPYFKRHEDHWRGGAPLTALARREVILCAGAVSTPLILQRSGIGPAALLHEHGVQPLLELPGVGENLQDHLQIRAVFAVQGVPTLNALVHSPLGKARIGLEYLLRRSGPMSMAPSQLGAFTRSAPAYAWPNVEYHVQPLSLDAFGEPLHRDNAFTASVCNLNPTSRGFVQLRSPRADDAPRIQARYLSTAEDRQVAADSLRLTRRIAAMPALAAYQPREVKPGLQYQSDEDLARLAGDIGTTIFHPVGTCRMGNDAAAGAVVDARLRLHGLAGLRVADASVMPTITSGNTNAPTLMIAERASEWVLAEADAAAG